MKYYNLARYIAILHEFARLPFATFPHSPKRQEAFVNKTALTSNQRFLVVAGKLAISSCRFPKAALLDLRLDPPILNMLLFSINALAGWPDDEVVAYVGLFCMAKKKSSQVPRLHRFANMSLGGLNLWLKNVCFGWRFDLRIWHIGRNPSKSRMVSEFSSLLSAGTVGTPIWAALAKVLKPRQLLSFALLLQAMGLWMFLKCLNMLYWKKGSDRIGFKSHVFLYMWPSVLGIVFQSASLSPILGRKKMPFWMLGVMVWCWAGQMNCGNILGICWNDVIALRPTVWAFIALVCIEWHYSSVLFRWKGTWRLDTPVYDS